MTVGIIDFFSGCGGTSLGLGRAGMVALGGIDNDRDAAATYQLNNPGAKFALADVRNLGIDHILAEFRVNDVDQLVLAACAPCQPFTKQRTKRKEDDERIPLLLELTRFVRGLLPDVILVENVPGLQTFNDGDSPLSEFLGILEELGYRYDVQILEARKFGVPQRRARLVVLASLHGSPGFPDPTHGPGRKAYSTVRDWIGHLPVIDAGKADPSLKNHRAAALSAKNLERIRATPEGGDRRDWPRRLWLECHSGDYKGHMDVYGRMSWDDQATGLTTRCISLSNGRFGHPEQDRAISVREAACLQTFPLRYEFVGNLASMARQIGNAVPVLMAEVLGTHIVEHLSADREAAVGSNSSMMA